MQPEDIRKRLHTRPFQPFRIFLSDGASYDVRHPELLLLGHRSMVLGFGRQPEDTLYVRSMDIDLLHVVRMEPIETPVSGGNGTG